MVYSGLIASVLFDYSGTRRAGLERILPFNRTVIVCGLVALVGVVAMVPLVRTYLTNNFTLPSVGLETHRAVMGLWLVSAAFQTFIFSLMVRALGVVLPRRARSASRRQRKANAAAEIEGRRLARDAEAGQ